MEINKFYNIIDSELENILSKNQTDEYIKKLASNNNKGKGYAFLIWFLEFYGKKTLYKKYITDGKDDFSCDIIFSETNIENETVYYIIQSKWVDWKDRKKELKKTSKDEVCKALNDFETILRGDAPNSKNEHFNVKYNELINHLEHNGKAKFIFFSLGDENSEINTNIKSFNKEYAPNISVDVIDIVKIKRSYIEFKFKGIFTSNPLEYSYNSENETIDLPIERFEKCTDYSKKDYLEFEGKEKAYIFLLKPETIYKLFSKYKFSLFFNNVRNPLLRSNYNKNIENTLLKKPGSFWYFNNGITAITKMLPEVGKHAKNIELGGLQIINGAQTVYSVYTAYKNASELERRVMDEDARITLRLIRSSDEDFNLEITKYTNSQNPMNDRDFTANDDVQVRLQNESFSTDYWYEKRRGEFRINELEDKPKINIKIIPNSYFALAYITYYLQQPTKALLQDDKFFISHKEDKDGLYETIFNSETYFENILASFHICNAIMELFGDKNENEIKLDPRSMPLLLPSLALSKIVLARYLNLKLQPKKELNLSLYINSIFNNEYKEEEQLEIYKALSYSIDIIINLIKPKEGKEDDPHAKKNFQKLTSSNSFYEKICDDFLEANFNVEEIDKIILEEKIEVEKTE